MADGRFAGDEIAAGCAGDRRQRFIASGKTTILAQNPVTRGFETRFSIAKSGDPGIIAGQWPAFFGRTCRSRESNIRLSSGSDDFQTLRQLSTVRLPARPPRRTVAQSFTLRRRAKHPPGAPEAGSRRSHHSPGSGLPGPALSAPAWRRCRGHPSRSTRRSDPSTRRLPPTS